jgi:hypothetical protein
MGCSRTLVYVYAVCQIVWWPSSFRGLCLWQCPAFNDWWPSWLPSILGRPSCVLSSVFVWSSSHLLSVLGLNFFLVGAFCLPFLTGLRVCSRLFLSSLRLSSCLFLVLISLCLVLLFSLVYFTRVTYLDINSSLPSWFVTSFETGSVPSLEPVI